MENTKDPAGVSIKDLVAQLEAHEAFLMTPEGKEWKALNDKIVDYPSLLPKTPGTFRPNAIVDILKRGFKRGELSIIAGKPQPLDEPRSMLAHTLALEQMRAGDNVLYLNLEGSPRNVEERYLTIVRGKPPTDSEGAFTVTPITRFTGIDDEV